jgi:uncharacterized protein YlbG (UPF0298 family)
MTENMTTVCVRITEEEKQKLLKYGSLSHTLRDAMQLYLNTKKYEDVLTKLKELQAKNPIKTTTEEELRMIREDRNR